MNIEQFRQQCMGKTKAEVQAAFGAPHVTNHYLTAAEPQGVSPAELQAYRDQTLHEIWVYPQGRISFSISGVVRAVDDKTQLYIRPNPAVS